MCASLKKKDQRLISLVLDEKDFDFNSKITEDMLIVLPENIPYGALNVDFSKFKDRFEEEAFNTLVVLIENRKKLCIKRTVFPHYLYLVQKIFFCFVPWYNHVFVYNFATYFMGVQIEIFSGTNSNLYYGTTSERLD